MCSGVWYRYLAIRGVASTDGDQARFDSRVRALALYWYFVDIVWICVFVAFYLYLAAVLVLPETAAACPICFGSVDSPLSTPRVLAFS